MKFLEEFKHYIPKDIDHLYKYRSMKSSGIDDIFKKNKIYFPDPTKFNDPFDCKPYLVMETSEHKLRKFAASVLKKRDPFLSLHEINNQLKDESRYSSLKDKKVVKDFYKQFLKDFGVLCLSEIPKDILMWSHYADSHKGFCLQFKYDCAVGTFGDALKVEYKNQFPHVSVLQEQGDTEIMRSILCKSKHWDYEAECRVIRVIDEGGSKSYKFSPEELTGVILGAEMKIEDEERIRRLAAISSTPVTIYKAKLGERDYEIEVPGL